MDTGYDVPDRCRLCNAELESQDWHADTCPQCCAGLAVQLRERYDPRNRSHSRARRIVRDYWEGYSAPEAFVQAMVPVQTAARWRAPVFDEALLPF